MIKLTTPATWKFLGGIPIELDEAAAGSFGRNALPWLASAEGRLRGAGVNTDSLLKSLVAKFAGPQDGPPASVQTPAPVVTPQAVATLAPTQLADSAGNVVEMADLENALRAKWEKEQAEKSPPPTPPLPACSDCFFCDQKTGQQNIAACGPCYVDSKRPRFMRRPVPN